MIRANIESYMKRCDECLASKAIKHKSYSDLQYLSGLMHEWKKLFIDFVTRLSVSIN